MAKEEIINIRVSSAEKSLVKKEAAKLGLSIKQYVMSGKCACGKEGYEGLFESIMWKCGACGKVNHWRKK
jgi:hypothetical protein